MGHYNILCISDHCLNSMSDMEDYFDYWAERSEEELEPIIINGITLDECNPCSVIRQLPASVLVHHVDAIVVKTERGIFPYENKNIYYECPEVDELEQILQRAPDDFTCKLYDAHM